MSGNRIDRKVSKSGKLPKGNKTRPIDYYSYDTSQMARKGKRKRARRVRRRSRRGRMNGYFKSSLVPVKQVIEFSSTSGSNRRYTYPITISSLTAAFKSTFDEFKVQSITVIYRPNETAETQGVYVGVLLDHNGFGDYGASTASAWFKTLGAFPGSKIRHRHIPSTYYWRPTEPTARDWYRGTDPDRTLARIYICDNEVTSTTAVFGGLFEINARVRMRGLYYGAAVKAALQQKTELSHLSVTPDISDLEIIDHNSSP